MNVCFRRRNLMHPLAHQVELTLMKKKARAMMTILSVSAEIDLI